MMFIPLHALRRYALCGAGVWLMGVLGGAAQPALAQGPDHLPATWTLEQCIDYATQHSLEVQRQALQGMGAQAQLREAQWAFAPSIGASASHAYDFGRAIDFGSNTVSNDLQSTSFDVGANLTLFDGLANVRMVQLRRLELEGSAVRREVAIAELSLSVARAYLQVIYQEELVRTHREQLAINTQQLDLGRKRAEAGAITQGAVLELQSQLATAEQTLVNAENALALAKLQLLQVMNLRGFTNITLVKPSLDSARLPALPLVGVEQLYHQALASYPTIRNAELEERQAEKQLQIAKARHYPILSLRASYGSGARFYLSAEGHRPEDSFMEQMRKNGTQRVGLSLSIPIFDRFATSTSVTRARIGVQQAGIAKQQAENNLYKSIQSAYQDAVAGLRQMESARRNLAQHEEAFKWAEAKLAVGAISTYDFSQAQYRFTQARISLLQSTIDYLFKMKILAFYQGVPLIL